MFDAANTRMAVWGSFGTGPGQFYEPGAIAVDDSKAVYVADYSDRIQVGTGSLGALQPQIQG